MTGTSNPIPTISSTAFTCPHCGVLTSQTWYSLYVKRLEDNSRTPKMPDPRQYEHFINNPEIDADVKRRIIQFTERVFAGKPFIEFKGPPEYLSGELCNLNASSCYNCKNISVWVHDRIAYPQTRVEIDVNADLPEYIRSMSEEARAVVDQSPKGASALLRLCIQHLFKELGESGADLDRDTENLVAKGLSPLVQEALAVVRVIGQERVAPGQIRLHDDRETAVRLLQLVNLIAEQMISHPKNVRELYEKLPTGKPRPVS
jgi:hypothetical protein